MIFQHLLEQRGRLTGPERKAFIKQINTLIAQTGKFETKKVDAMIELLARAKGDIQDTIFDLTPLEKKAFSGATAAQLKREIERRLAEFEVQARGLMGRSQAEFAQLGKDYTDALITSQAGVPPPGLGVSPVLVQQAATRSADLITSLSRRQIGQASDIINRAVITGRSPFQVAKELAGSFDKGLSQMETIARTEMLGIHSQVQAAELNDLAETVPKLKKQWITVVDQRTRDTHRAVHLVSIPNNQAFTVGDAKLRFPRDPAGAIPAEVINCRCTLVPDFEEVTEEPRLSALEMPPPKAPLGGLARKVAARVRKIKR